MKKGFWIAIEGNNGAGKSYQVTRLAQYLRTKGLKVVTTREPGGNDYSEKLRDLILDPEIIDDPRTQLLLFTVARRRNILKTVSPALRDGKIVISDRCEASSFSYQHYQYGLPLKLVKEVNDFATEGTRPDLVIFLSVSEEVGLERIKQAKPNHMNYFDKASLSDWRKRQKGYQQLAKQKSWVTVNANHDKTKVFEEILEAIKFLID